MDQWKEQYNPKINIQESWYSNLLVPITIQEIRETIENLPTKKTPGPSNISYEFIKYTTKSLLPYLHHLFNSILTGKKVPQWWKSYNIFPISKKLLWQFNIKETRPIALLDSFRKIFTKILTKRLSNILTKHLFSPMQTSPVSPNQSTFEPIQILNSIYSIHKMENKELWILSLDISTAFDSVNH